jgi:integrase
MTVADIGPADVLRCIEPIWKAKRETASRVRQRIERIFDYATTRAYRAGDNPAAHVTESLPRNGRNVEHLAALPYAELPAFMAELRKRQGIAARALELTILTAARTGETIGALWDEIDLKAKTWVVPADRMKARQEHTVPLSDRVVDILKHLPREGNNQHVFVGPKAGEGLSNMAMTAVLRRMGRGDITVHGFRSTFRTWASEQTAFPHEVCEKALAHTIPNAVERAYNRGALLAKRKQLMDAWSKYCASPPATAREANVVPLRGA